MAVSFYFVHSGFTSDKYHQALEKLEAAGAGAPAGRLYHVALESNGEIQVFDIWESEEAFAAFGEVIIPVLESLGVELGQPMVAPVHNVIVGG